MLRRHYLVPSYVTAAKGEAEALDLLAKVLAGGITSRLYRRLVVEQKVAANAGGYYMGNGLDCGKLSVYAVPAEGISLDDLERALDGVLADIVANGVTDAELTRAKKSYIADYIYENDNQTTLARRFGWALVVGQTVRDVERWPEDLTAVTGDQVKAAAARYFDPKLSVTGRLLPDKPVTASATAKPSSPAVPSGNRS